MLLKNIQELEKTINSELTSKIKKSTIAFNEILIETDADNLLNIIQFLKSNDNCKFKQLIDIAGIDFPEKDKRFRLVYLFLSHEKNLRIKISIDFDIQKKIPSISAPNCLTQVNSFACITNRSANWIIPRPTAD